MATVQTTITPTMSIKSYSGIVDRVTERSPIPRGEICFQTINAGVAAAGVGDNQSILIDMGLPENFTYAMTDLQVLINTDSGGATYNLGSSAILDIVNSPTTVNRTLDVRTEMVSDNELTLAGTQNARVYRPTSIPKLLLSSESGANVDVQFRIYNTTANDGAYDVYCSARFLQYDVSQALYWDVNTPTLTR